MNPAFKAKYEQMRDGKPTEDQNRKSSDITGNEDKYIEPGHIRYLCLEWPSGKKQFLNYSYLVTGEYSDDGNIILEFTTHIVKISGSCLENLYRSIILQIAMRIVCTDARYNALKQKDQTTINEIKVSKNN